MWLATTDSQSSCIDFRPFRRIMGAHNNGTLVQLDHKNIVTQTNTIHTSTFKTTLNND